MGKDNNTANISSTRKEMQLKFNKVMDVSALLYNNETWILNQCDYRPNSITATELT